MSQGDEYMEGMYTASGVRSKLSRKATTTANDWKEGMSGMRSLFGEHEDITWWRMYVFYGVIGIIVLILLQRVFFLQVVKGSEYVVRAERNRVYSRYTPADRGVIYDRAGEVLARNVPSYSLHIIYNELPDDVESIKQKIADILEIPIEELSDGFKRAQTRLFDSMVVAINISHEKQLVIQSRYDELVGVTVVKSALRQYPQGKYMSSLLGYTGKISDDEFYGSDAGTYVFGEFVGKTGIEYQYESDLRGEVGQYVVEVEATGKVNKEIEVTQSTRGDELTLSIDINVQKKLFELMEKYITKVGSTGGSAIITNVRTGQVYAMVSLPTYDNNVFTTGSSKEVVDVLTNPEALLINRGLSGSYPPGSTVKMAIGAMALEKGVIKPSTQISGSPQVISINGFDFPDWTYSWGRGPHGMMDLPGAIANSSDIFFYKVGGGYPPECKVGTVRCEIEGLGVNGVVEALRTFGFGSRVGIDLPGENAGLVPDPLWKEQVRNEDWYLGNTYHLSIGQGDLLATPLQVLNLTNIVATDGSVPVPHVVTHIGGVAVENTPQIENPVSLQNLKLSRQGMIDAVSVGIVFPLRGAKVPVAAKTGTAEFGTLNAKGEYSTHAWVTGYAPVEDPQISFVVMLESGDKSEYAADVAREFIDWYFGEYLEGKR